MTKPGDPDDVGIGIEVDRFNVFVAEHDLVRRWCQPGKGRQREVGKNAALAQARQEGSNERAVASIERA